MNLPNKITVARILLIPVFIVFFYLEFPAARYIAAGVFIIASLTDTLDGYLARSRNLITDLGKFLDPIADKLLTTAAFILLVEKGMIPAVIVVVIIAREFIVNALRMVASARGIVLAAGWLGKIKTATQMIAVIILLLADPSWALFGITIGDVAIWVCFVFTLWSGVDYMVRNTAVLKSMAREN